MSATSRRPPISPRPTTRSPPISASIDVLVNNAGTSRAMAFETITDEIWQEDLDLKLFAAIRFSRLVWPGMKARKWGRIINVLNTGAKAPAAASTPTSVSRAAGMALTKAMANEGGAHNILVNAMLVGLIISDQWVKRHAAEGAGHGFRGLRQGLAKGIPLGPDGHGGGIRQPRLLPRLGAGLLHHRHRHQCRWRPFTGGVRRCSSSSHPSRRAAGAVLLRMRSCHCFMVRSAATPRVSNHAASANVDRQSYKQKGLRFRRPFLLLKPRPWRP